MSLNSNTQDLNTILDTMNNLPLGGGGLRQIGQMIDESGVLDSTEGTVAEKVEQLIEKANVKGIILSDFSQGYGTPRIADMRSMPVRLTEIANNNQAFVFAHLFRNNNTNANGGFYVFLEEVYLMDKFPIISSYMFYQCGKLHTLHGDLTEVKSVSDNAFYGCKSLNKFPYMPKLKTISAGAYGNCTGLTEITLPNTLTSIAANSFNGCTNITDIYCGFAEGAVANAPWGATNATIHYNTQYDADGNPITE